MSEIEGLALGFLVMVLGSAGLTGLAMYIASRDTSEPTKKPPSPIEQIGGRISLPRALRHLADRDLTFGIVRTRGASRRRGTLTIQVVVERPRK